MGRISMDIWKLVVKKINEGWSQRKITKDLSIVQNILMKLRGHDTIEDLPKTGCPALNSARSVRVLIRDSKKTAPGPTEIMKIKSVDLSKQGAVYSEKLQCLEAVIFIPDSVV